MIYSTRLTLFVSTICRAAKSPNFHVMKLILRHEIWFSWILACTTVVTLRFVCVFRCNLCISQFHLRQHPPPPPSLRWGSWVVKSPRVGTKKDGKCPVLRCRKLFRFWNILTVHYKCEIRYKTHLLMNSLFRIINIKKCASLHHARNQNMYDIL